MGIGPSNVGEALRREERQVPELDLGDEVLEHLKEQQRLERGPATSTDRSGEWFKAQRRLDEKVECGC
jgi:hypothetical protein